MRPVYRLFFAASGLFKLALFILTLAFSSAGGAQEPWRWSDIERLVVIPDIHGAYPEFEALLLTTGVIDETLAWAGGETHLVSLGDLLDRGSDSRKAMDLLMRLQKEAPMHGGMVHVVLGNHELMNLTGDMRYVANAEYAAFAGEEPGEIRARAFQWFINQQPEPFSTDEEAQTAFSKEFPTGYFGLRAGFGSSGHYGSWLLGLPPIVVINDTAFVHGGLPELVSTLDLEDLNTRLNTDLVSYVTAWENLIAADVLSQFESQNPRDLAAEALMIADPSRCIEERAMVCKQVQKTPGTVNPDVETVAILERFMELSRSPVFSTDGPLWYRGSVYCKPILEEPVLNAALKRLGVNRVVVGHTPTADRQAHSLYDGRLILLDTGMLVSYYSGRPAALIIEGDRIEVQYLNPTERVAPETGGQPVAYGLKRHELMKALTHGTLKILNRGENGAAWQVQVTHGDKELQAIFYVHDRGRPDRLELAAFQLDSMLGLDLVPPTVARKLEGRSGALQLWYPDTLTEAQRIARQISIGGWCPIKPQFDLMSAFDLLTDNSGRSGQNVLYRQRLWSLHLTGHGKAFGTRRKLPDAAGKIKPGPGFTAALRSLDQHSLEAAMGDWMSRKQIRALLSRRDSMLQLIGAE